MIIRKKEMGNFPQRARFRVANWSAGEELATFRVRNVPKSVFQRIKIPQWPGESGLGRVNHEGFSRPTDPLGGGGKWEADDEEGAANHCRDQAGGTGDDHIGDNRRAITFLLRSG